MPKVPRRSAAAVPPRSLRPPVRTALIGLAFRTAILIAIATPAAAQPGAPGGPVPVDALRARRASLIEHMGGGILVLRSGTLRSIEGDYPQDSDYREKNDFFYLTGIESPDSWLVAVARPGTEAEVRLYLPSRDEAAERWTGAKLGPGPEARALTGIEDVRPAELAESEIAALLADPAAPRALFAELGDADDCRAGQRPCVPALDATAVTAPENTHEVRDLTAALRLIKDADELRRLRRAIEITADAHIAAMQAVSPGTWEYELEAIIEYTFRKKGAERVGFPSIVGSGPNAVTLHYDKSRRQVQAGDLVVIDIGAEFGYYSADVTRTIPVSGSFTDRQRAIYRLVLGAQQAAMDAVRPGVTVGELNQVAREYIEQNSGSLCGSESCNQFFVHGLAHWLGMDVHDVGAYATPLAPGMVLTIEPGIYIASENLGVRIEDDILVTGTGYELLSKGAPRDPGEIEKVIAKGRGTTNGREDGTSGIGLPGLDARERTKG